MFLYQKEVGKKKVGRFYKLDENNEANFMHTSILCLPPKTRITEYRPGVKSHCIDRRTLIVHLFPIPITFSI